MFVAEITMFSRDLNNHFSVHSAHSLPLYMYIPHKGIIHSLLMLLSASYRDLLALLLLRFMLCIIKCARRNTLSIYVDSLKFVFLLFLLFIAGSVGIYVEQIRRRMKSSTVQSPHSAAKMKRREKRGN